MSTDQFFEVDSWANLPWLVVTARVIEDVQAVYDFVHLQSGEKKQNIIANFQLHCTNIK